MAQAPLLTPRAERTREAILSAAEILFAQRGFAATRLEDVAEQVGIRRASIVYYFADKRALYDAVLAQVLGALLERMRGALLASGPVATRIENAVSAWVEFVGTRPTFARLLLREVANATPEQGPRTLSHTRAFFDLVESVIAEVGDDWPGDADLDPAHVASTIAGATLFFVAAMPALVPDLGFDPSSPPQLARHREQVLRITRRLLGTSGPRRTGGRAQRKQP